MTKRGRTRALLAVPLILAGLVNPAQAGPAAAAAPQAADVVPCGVQAGGLIGDRWQGLNAGGGPLGCPTAPEEAVPNSNARRQPYEHGEIVYSPSQGAKMVVSAYLERNEAVIDWGSTEGHTYSFFMIGWKHNGLTRVEAAAPAPADHGTFSMPLTRGPGRYEFQVLGCDGVPNPQNGQPQPTCRDGYTFPVALTVPDLSAQPSDCTGPAVDGLIGQRWRELGAGAGKLGCPTSPQVGEPLGRRQYFQHGSLVFSPRQGTNMVVAVYSINNQVFVEWGPTDPFFYDKFIVRWNVDGKHEEAWQRDIYPYKERRREGFTRFWAPNGHVEVIVEGCDGDCKQGWTLTATTEVFYTGGTDVRDVSATDPARALDNLDVRRSRAAEHQACQNPLDISSRKAGEGEITGVAAHLETVRRQGTDFRCPGQASSVELANRLLRQATTYPTGSTFDDVFICEHRYGDYDMFLKGLMVVMYRYGDLLYPLSKQHARNYLFSETGPHSTDDEHIEACNLDVSETENHRLMIETSKYLSNQLLWDVNHNNTYDNAANGLRDYLLPHIQKFAQYDFMEYNSRPYSRLAAHALMNLYDYARDQKIRVAAQIVLDYLTTKFGLSSNDLRRAGPFRRQKEREDEEIHTYYGGDSDPMTGMFLLWTGFTPNTGGFIPDSFTGEANIATFSSYLPPRAAIWRAMDKSEPYQQTFYHGNRPKMSYSPDNPDPAVEIYSSSPSFLLTAGGVWTNSGYGYDVRRSYKLVGSAQSTTLMPTKNIAGHGEVKFEDLIRFRGRSDDRSRYNICVSGGFACGYGFAMPDVLNTCADHVVNGNWDILNLDTEKCGKLGMYVATQIVDTKTQEFGKTGLFYAMESSKMDFGKFSTDTLQLNANPQAGTFRSPDGHTFVFNYGKEDDKYAAQVTSVDGGTQPHWSATGLAQGPTLRSNGHDGYIEIKYPKCDATTVLDYRDAANPSITTQWGTCH
ncbi:LGFP repeat-containing protein [Amycolatopsis sp. NPDC059657]|uniref:LGFP repeat-containing protein n=1 Tax=Amycolatopsis sp. NPDC059657 TaxID=3346899 RepID=UPI00366FB946